MKRRDDNRQLKPEEVDALENEESEQESIQIIKKEKNLI